jgi:molybdopterin synthase sulfur carrier subunit
MALTILYFAWVREKIGTGEETVEVPAHVTTARVLAGWLAGRSNGHRAALSDLARIRVAVDQAFADLDAPIAGAREIAFFPPVTGG